MIINLIAAMSSNRVIGSQGTIPWHIPEDMRHFRELTTGHTLIMGRRTYESIGRALPGRVSIIVTGQADYFAAGCLTASSLDEALRLAAPSAQVFICGGGELYRQALPLTARIYLTVIDEIVAGDTTFPEIPVAEFDMVTTTRISAVPDAVLGIYVRKPGPPQESCP